jgi:hypothetical protein
LLPLLVIIIGAVQLTPFSTWSALAVRDFFSHLICRRTNPAPIVPPMTRVRFASRHLYTRQRHIGRAIIRDVRRYVERRFGTNVEAIVR